MALKVNTARMKFWAKEQLNVLFVGKHGVGKTEMVKAIFNELYGEMGKDWLYFSASTMDPWVDFIGVPKERQVEDGVVLEFVRRAVFSQKTIKAMFFDELNRAHSKVRNAVMELVQFKTVNGDPMEGLEIVWAAINPDDELDEQDERIYDVERLDPAQLDRFHIHAEIPYEVDRAYFTKKYGSDHAQSACDWWDGLSKEHKEAVSPRRLDYAIQVRLSGGEIRGFVVPLKCNVGKLEADLKHGSPILRTAKLYEKCLSVGPNDPDWKSEAKEFVRSTNNWHAIAKEVVKKPAYQEVFLPLLGAEELKSLASDKDVKTREFVLGHMFSNPGKYKEVLDTMVLTYHEPVARNKATHVLDKWQEKHDNYQEGDLAKIALASGPSLPATFNKNIKRCKKLQIMSVPDDRMMKGSTSNDIGVILLEALSGKDGVDPINKLPSDVRIEVLNRIIFQMGENLTPAEAAGILCATNQIISASQKATLEAIPLLPKAINTAITCLHQTIVPSAKKTDADNMSVEKMVGHWPFTFAKYIWPEMKNDCTQFCLKLEDQDDEEVEAT